MDVLQAHVVKSALNWFPDEPLDPKQAAEEMNHVELLHSNGCHYDCIVYLDGAMSCAEPMMIRNTQKFHLGHVIVSKTVALIQLMKGLIKSAHTGLIHDL